jgi:hypothetical protein
MLGAFSACFRQKPMGSPSRRYHSQPTRHVNAPASRGSFFVREPKPGWLKTTGVSNPSTNSRVTGTDGLPNAGAGSFSSQGVWPRASRSVITLVCLASSNRNSRSHPGNNDGWTALSCVWRFSSARSASKLRSSSRLRTTLLISMTAPHSRSTPFKRVATGMEVNRREPRLLT